MQKHTDEPLTDTLRRGDGTPSNAPYLDAFWYLVATLLKWRVFIIGITAFVAILSIVLSLMMTEWYRAETRLLSPESSGTNPLSAALSSNLSAAASALLGRSGGDFFRYISILSSRTMYEKVVDEFDLVTAYETQDSKYPRSAAIKMLAENVDFPIDNEYEYLSIAVYDMDPQRAADIANFLVEELNIRNQELAAQDASNYRTFVENRHQEAIRDLDSLKTASQAFQLEYGVFDLESQAQVFLEQLAAIRTEEITLEIEYEALKAQYGEDNARVKTAGSAFSTARLKTREALEGQEEVFPVSRQEFPTVFREFVDLEQELLTQKSILEVITPLLEQARFQEERKYQAVQVVDAAIPPERKAKPKKSIIVIGATLSAFLVSVLFVLGFDWWRKNYSYISRRIQEARSKA
ncbi:MAG: lipopolysaccharide biosynthesis protein [Rhodothermaceae bacterium]|nr:lipopolysaccharide biosynthesis protein [Rhodothermaceae bacterium]